MRTRVIALLALAFVLASVPRAESAVCATSTIFGTYVFNLGGTDAEGRSISSMAVAAFMVADANGNGTFNGTIFNNERGQAPETRAIIGNYQLLNNCWLTLQLTQQVGTTVRVAALTGFVSQNGALIIFASPFDAGVQLTGIATLVPF